VPKTLEEELRSDSFLQNFSITVERTGSEIILTGKVRTHYQKSIATSLAMEFTEREGKSLLNKIEVG
jgi:osmotically-inducible protein OsmY